MVPLIVAGVIVAVMLSRSARPAARPAVASRPRSLARAWLPVGAAPVQTRPPLDTAPPSDTAPAGVAPRSSLDVRVPVATPQSVNREVTLQNTLVPPEQNTRAWQSWLDPLDLMGLPTTPAQYAGLY